MNKSILLLMLILLSGMGAAGVGFYVSTHPYDSTDYGNRVTVFDIRRPLVILEAAYEPLEKTLLYSEELALNARQVGIDGFTHTGYQKTWLSLINENQLQRPRKISQNELVKIMSEAALKGETAVEVKLCKFARSDERI